MTATKGRLISAPIWRVHCAECDKVDTAAGYHIHTHMEAAEWFTGVGWVKSDAGWLCPGCAADESEGEQ